MQSGYEKWVWISRAKRNDPNAIDSIGGPSRTRTCDWLKPVALPMIFCSSHLKLNFPVFFTTIRKAKTYYIFYYSKILCDLRTVSKLLSRLEAAIGIEPMNKGFADHSD